jgi:ribosomal protein S12 methylthiotransferase accessory factor
VQEGLRTRTGGKGVTDVQARMSAVGEAIERYCGVARGDEPARHGTMVEIGPEAVDPRRCLHYSDAQYDGRAAWNAGCASIFHQVPHRFDERLAIDWAPLWSLTHDARRYLPAAFCWYGHPDSRRHYFCAGDTNGCAAGATPEEAMLQALFELVERDAVAIWWYNRLSRPGLELGSFAIPYIERVRLHHAGLGRDVWALDLTHDLTIPVFAALSRRTDGGTEDIVFGFGAHFDPTEALMRAVTEMNQFLPAVLKRDAAGNTAYAWPEDDAIRFWQHETLASQPWLGPSPAARRRSCDFATPPPVDVGEMLRHAVDICRDHRLEVLAQNQTRPDIDLPVYRMVVPGLRHFWRRFGPGRLYDVPVAMGWRATPIAEADLNPIPVFI